MLLGKSRLHLTTTKSSTLSGSVLTSWESQLVQQPVEIFMPKKHEHHVYNLQGVFFDWFRSKSSKCQPVSKFWHFYYVIWYFLGGTSKKDTLYNIEIYLNIKQTENMHSDFEETTKTRYYWYTKYSWACTIYATRYPTRYPDFFPLPYPNPTRSKKNPTRHSLVMMHYQMFL